MRGLKSTLALLVVLAGLGGYIYFVDAKRPAAGAEEKAKAVTVAADKLQELRVTAGGETTVLHKADGTWKITEPEDMEADQTEVSSLTTSLTTLDVNRVVDDNATDLAQYGLATPAIQIAFKADGNASGGLAFGDKTPSQGDLYAMRTGEKKVFLVSAFVENTFDKKPFDLRDKRILRFERDKVDSLEVAMGQTHIVLARDGSAWTVKQPLQARGDYGTIEGLLTRLSSAPMTKLVASAPKDLKPYGLAQPDEVLTIGAGSSKAELAIAKEQNGEIHAQDRTRNLVFTIDSTLATDLRKTLDDYRDKDLFEFRPFNTDHVKIVRGADTYDFQKIAAKDGAPEKWQMAKAASAGASTNAASSAGAAAKDSSAGGLAKADVEGAKVDDLLSKLVALRAQSFSGSADSTGLQEPALIVSVSYDGGKFERVRFGRSGGQAFGARDQEPGAARLDQAAFDEALKALDAAAAPPAPTTTQTGTAPAAKPDTK